MAVRFSRAWLKRLVFVAIALVAAGLCFLFQPVNPELSRQANGQTLFTKQPLQDKIFRLFDLGVADVNSDGKLDIYTSNHSNEQFLLLNQGKGNFSDNQIVPYHLNQDPEFPGLEYSLKRSPQKTKPGLYIYWTDRRLNIETHNLENPENFRGNISVAAPLDIKKQQGIDSEVTFSPFADGEVASSLNFVPTKGNGKLTLLAENVALPFVFQMDEKTPLKQVFVGLDNVSPQKYRFDLFMRDRHGMAWRDINGDGKLDVYIVRGALKGRIDKLPGTFADELLVQDKSGDRFTDVINPEEIKKGNCPSLQTAWVDANADQNLDIFTLCYKPTIPIETYPPQVYIQNGNDKYQEEAAQLNLDLKQDGSFVWLDVDNDGDQDLVRSTSDSFLLFRYQDGKFKQENLGQNPGGVAKTFDGSNNLSMADYDNDGDVDILAASPKGNALLMAQDGTFKVLETSSLGLPNKSFLAQWVDYDNDGLTDLYTLPEGLYRQNPDNNFKMTGLLKDKSSQGILEARATWFDADNDGDRDLITAINYRDPLYHRIWIKGFKQELPPGGWLLNEYLNQSQQKNHWIELDLKGKAENPQAIGSQVDINTDLGTQRLLVGQADGSHYSQGHYRLYVGLGTQTKPVQLNIRWPDGTTQTQTVSTFDQTLTLTQSA